MTMEESKNTIELNPTDKAPKSTRDQFADWLENKMGIAPADSTVSEVPESSQSYPIVRDAGEVNLRGMGTPRDQFIEWFNEVL